MGIQVHLHKKPQCWSIFGWWVHDPGCANFGPEIGCHLIQQGKNKGLYLCIHVAPSQAKAIEAILTEPEESEPGLVINDEQSEAQIILRDQDLPSHKKAAHKTGTEKRRKTKK